MARLYEKMSDHPRKKVVIVGGGTGNFTALSGLKKYPVDLAAIVSMSDSGGHSGKLRDELGVLPPGDVRACLVALADDDKAKLVRDLFNYRFESGTHSGASVGNLLLAALADILGDFNKAVLAAQELLDIKGRVIPSTLERVDLLAELLDGTILFGETAIDLPRQTSGVPVKRVWLQPKPEGNPEAVRAILEADLVAFGPGDLYTSIMPNLCIPDLLGALGATKATLVGNVNIMTKFGETNGYGVEDFVQVLERALGRELDVILFNTAKIPAKLLKKYKGDNAGPVEVAMPLPHWRGLDLLSTAGEFARHDSDKLARALIALLDQ
ncbi:MAG: gluconeogenesis factor YvcK family protein [Patescibacteria group bacterium]